MSFLLLTGLSAGLATVAYLYKYGCDMIPLFVGSMKTAVFLISKYQQARGYFNSNKNFIEIISVEPYNNIHKITYEMDEQQYIVISNNLSADITTLNSINQEFIQNRQTSINNTEKRVIQATLDDEDVLEKLHKYLGPLGDYHKFIHGITHKLNDIWTSGTLRIMDIECNEMEYGLYDDLI